MHRNRSLQRGLTLVEIMVAITVSLILLTGVVQIFTSSKQTYRIQEATARLQENGRFAINLLAQDIRMADYWGCAGGLTNITNRLDPAGPGFTANTHAFAAGLTGTDNTGLNGSDSFTLRGADSGGIAVVSPFGPLPAASIQVSSDNTLAPNDIVLISDCTAGDIFQITNITAGGGASRDALVHNTGTASPGNLTQQLTQVYEGDASILSLVVKSYTVRAGASGQPALFRSENAAAAVELVEGVENMQVLYGEDDDADGAADYYVAADTAVVPNRVTDMDNVVSIRVSLLLRTLEDNIAAEPQTYFYNGASVTAGDERIRHVFTTTVGIRNRLR